ncbi:glycosyltransferase [Cognatishimia activa]|uniref:glycosyltransferase n=1 Tax=Cognatishimia activa TaxID=1715691 RepID=UPI00222F153B|nr:glycosyltransferase [Cognatishimia activa]UZD91704.1 glycosyltransferase [Cognatishimia activa]
MSVEVGIVAIGRNEGERLKACLASLPEVPVVYVDSGSTDGSVVVAREYGADIVELSAYSPFTAARARREGYERLKQTHNPKFVQFIDGDCLMVQGWLDAALDAMRINPEVGIVTGWRRELHPEVSLYNDLCHHEWNRPAGDILTCGGDMLVRSEVLDQAGPFDDTVIAAEDDEFCVRVRKSGWKIHRIPSEMTRHDAAMLRFGQWWQRAVRSGHGFAQVGHMHPPYFAREQKRVLVYGLAVPAIILLSLIFSPIIAVLGISAYLYNYIRTVSGLRGEGLSTGRALRHASLITLSKLPNAIGLIEFHRRRIFGRKMQIIEYK